MGTEQYPMIREQLLSRRHRLEHATPAAGQEDTVRRLLREVDAALDRIETSSYGLCETCHESIEPDRLAADPLLNYCLDHLTPSQQKALEYDLDLSRRVQSDLLPKRELRYQGWDVVYHYQPAGPVSGDYCDLLDCDGSLYFVVGDVMGKGVAASLLMSHLHAIFRSLVPLGLPLGELMSRVNRVFCEATGGRRYATIVCGRAGRNGEVELCNAGHCPPIHLRRSGSVTLPSDGFPVGLFAEAPWTARRFHLEPQENLLLYTDGVTESRDRAGAEYGTDRLAQVAASASGRILAELLRCCLDDVTAFRAGAPQPDDLTLLALRRGI